MADVPERELHDLDDRARAVPRSTVNQRASSVVPSASGRSVPPVICTRYRMPTEWKSVAVTSPHAGNWRDQLSTSSSSDHVASQPGLLGQLAKDAVARMLSVLEATARQRPPAVAVAGRTRRQPAEQDPLRPVHADRVRRDPRDPWRLMRHADAVYRSGSISQASSPVPGSGTP